MVIILLFLGVYIAPALACFPNLLRQPNTAIAVPVISSLIAVILTSLLLYFNLFTHQIVLSITVIFVLIAAIRLKCHEYYIHNINSLKKYKSQYKILLFNFILMLPFFVKLGTHSFDQGDEIYSWNYWAIQHYLQMPADFTHTGAPYPQFLPKLLAYQYQLLANIEYQLPIKALLGLFSFSLLNALALSYAHRSIASKLNYGILLLWVVFGIGLQHFFNDGYADPIMSASLVLSVYYSWLAYQHKFQNQSQDLYWALAVATALVAAYAKQPALLWLGAILPIGYFIFSNSKINLKSVVFFVMTTGMALLWLFTEGKHFENNGGVIGASLQQRDVFSHLQYLLEFYFIRQPMLALFLILSIIGLGKYIYSGKLNKQKKFSLFILLCLILPYLILWFTFGAYQLRLGQHVIALLSLMIIISGYRGVWGLEKLKLKLKLIKINLKTIRKAIRILSFSLVLFSVCASVFLGLKQEYKKMEGMAWQVGGLRTVRSYFSYEDTQKVADKLYDKSDICLWVPTRYLYGVFYGHTQVVMPDQNWTVQDFIKLKPDYMITASKEITSAEWVDQLQNIIAFCPTAFHPLTQDPNRFDYKVYKVKLDALGACVS